MTNCLEYTGIESISVSLEKELADVTFQSDLISEQAIIDQIDDMGFEASKYVPEDGLIKTTFSIVGMRCKSCVAKITSECEGVYGVEQVSTK